MIIDILDEAKWREGTGPSEIIFVAILCFIGLENMHFLYYSLLKICYL